MFKELRKIVFSLFIAICQLFLLAAISASGQPQENLSPRRAQTMHDGIFNGKHLNYTAVAEETFLYGKDKNAPEASVITFSYILNGVARSDARPVLFIFNGGPGASSSPLHLHAFGPYIFPSPGSGEPGTNQNSLLDVADLVFIDPVGTGYSRLFNPDSCRKYWDVRGDAESIIYVINEWRQRYDRERSHLYLCGESYGTIRIAEMLGRNRSFPVAGVIMLSAALDMSSWSPVPGNDLPYVLNLPTMAAIARYHSKGSLNTTDPVNAFKAAYEFVSARYIPELAKGNNLTVNQKEKLASELSDMTGIPVDTIKTKDLRLNAEDFETHLLIDEKKRTGQLDGRKTGPLQTDLKPPYNDPSMNRGDTSSTRLRKEYFNNILGFRDTGNYKSLNLEVNSAWNWTSALKEFYFTVLPEFSKAAWENPDLRIFVAGGIFDLATPLAAAKYQLDHSGIPSGRIKFETFPTGHSIFEDQEQLKVIAKMIRQFILN